QVFRRVAKRGFVQVEASNEDRVRSKVLGCFLREVRGADGAVELRLGVGARGDELVPTEAEAERAEKERERAEKERERAEKERERAEKERERAEKERAQAAEGRERAEKERERAARLEAEAELERLRALLQQRPKR
ncbi:MAG TPA: hypothetical protein VFS00_34515, partial [Polyangiaceae bacterium]|nr:hypothetical protein [Polyangiaceae bacterium]